MAKDYTVQVTINGRDKASGKFEKFSKGVAKWMKHAELAAIAAAIAFSALSMKGGMDFEAQMSNVQAVSRATAGEMAALSEKAKQLGRDSAFTASETGEAMEFLAMAGLKPAEVLAAVGDTLNLAAAGSLDLASAADIASNVLTGFNLKAEEMARVADVMAETAASSNTNIQQLGEAMSYVAPQAAAAGWSLEETAAAIGMLGNAGIQGSMAGTVLRGAINGLLNPSEAAYQAMRNLGISVEDSSGRMLSLEEILKQVDPAVLDTADGLGELTKVFGTRATPGIVSLIKQGADNLGEFKTQLEGSAGAAERMASVKLDNLKGSLTLLKSSFEGLGIALVTGGENSIVSGLQAFVSDGIIPALNATSQWIEQMGGLPGVFSLAWEIVTTFANDVKNAFIALGDWETFKEFVGAFGSALVVGIGLLSEFVLEIAGAIIKVASTLWLPIIAPFSVIISQMKELFMLFMNWLGDRFVNAVNKIVDPFRWVMKKVGVEIGKLDWTPLTVEPALKMNETWTASFQAIKGSFGEASDRMKTKTVELGENMKLVGGVMKEAIIDVNPEFDNYNDKVADIIEKHKKMGKSATDAADTAIEAVEKLPPVIEDAGDESAKHFGPGSSLWTSITNLGSKITSSMLGGWDMYKENIPSLEMTIEGHMQSMGTTIEGSLTDSFATAIKTGKISFKQGMKDIADAGALAIADTFSKEAMKSIVGPAVDEMVGLFEGGFSSVKGLAESLFGGIADLVTERKSMLTGALESAGTTGGTVTAAGGALLAVAPVAVVAGVVSGTIYAVKGMLDNAAKRKEYKKKYTDLNVLRERLEPEQIGIYGTEDAAQIEASYVDAIAKAEEAVRKNRLGHSGYRNWKAYESAVFTGIAGDKNREEYSKELEETREKVKHLFSIYRTNYAEIKGFNFLREHPVLMESIYKRGVSMYDLSKLGSSLTEVQKLPSYHTGGLVNNEGLFLGLSGEGVLNRRAMNYLGEGGLSQLNEGRSIGETHIYVIQAWDGEDVERVLDERIIPGIKEKSEAGVVVVHENGIKRDVA